MDFGYFSSEGGFGEVELDALAHGDDSGGVRAVSFLEFAKAETGNLPFQPQSSQQGRDQALRIIREHGLARFTQRSLVKTEDYLAELELVRRDGYALDNEEYLPGVKAVAVAIGNRHGLPLAIWVVGFAESMNTVEIARIADETRQAAVKLREVLDNRS